MVLLILHPHSFNLSISTAVLLCLRDNSHSKTSQDAQKVSPLIYTTTLGVITQVTKRLAWGYA
eukprot:18175-Amorphochlora_amoeboformis.AAC.1